MVIVVVQSLSHVWLFETPWMHHARFPHPSQSPRVCSNSCPLSQWYLPTISPSVNPYLLPSICPSIPGSFLMNLLFISGGQSIRALASALVLPMNTQDWFPLGWTGLISLQSKRLSRVFSSITVQNHQFLYAQPSLWSNSLIRTWLLGKTSLWVDGPLLALSILKMKNWGREVKELFLGLHSR